jgi:hypothetical protein
MSSIEQVVRNTLANASDVNVVVHQCTAVATAAAHKDVKIYKHSKVLAQLSNNPSAYTAAVRSETGNEEFTARAATFTRDAECAALVTSAKGNMQLCYIAQGTLGSPVYTIDGEPASKEDVAEFLTPSARKALLDPPTAVYNATQDVWHTVQVRTVNLSNIVAIEVE